MHNLPATCIETITAAADFRSYALPLLGQNAWIRGLPRIPTTKKEIKMHIVTCVRADERLHIQKLAGIGSESARIIVKMNTERSFIKEAFRQLRGEHPAQIALATILCGTRFKYPFQEILIPTECPNKRNRSLACGKEDSLEHLIKCYGLAKRYGTGVASIAFMVKVARRAAPEAPGVSIPKYIFKPL